MKKSKKLIIGSLIAITLGTVGALAAGGAEHRWGHGGDRANMIAERMMKHATEALDLTQEQQAYLEILQQKVIALKTEGMKGKFATRKIVMEQLSQPTLDQAQIMSMVQEQLRSAEEKAPAVIAALAQFSDSLTMEQKNIIKEKIEDRQKHRKDHH